MALLSRTGGLVDPFSSIWNQMDQMLQVFDQHTPHRAFAEDAKAIANTRVDWVENPESHIIKVELPGVNKEDIKVQLEDNRVLTISGERKKEEVKKDETWHVVERSHGKFLRRFRLPDNVMVDDICAKVENGVLNVKIPKARTESQQAKPIDVASSERHEQHHGQSATGPGTMESEQAGGQKMRDVEPTSGTTASEQTPSAMEESKHGVRETEHAPKPEEQMASA